MFPSSLLVVPFLLGASQAFAPPTLPSRRPQIPAPPLVSAEPSPRCADVEVTDEPLVGPLLKVTVLPHAWTDEASELFIRDMSEGVRAQGFKSGWYDLRELVLPGPRAAFGRARQLIRGLNVVAAEIDERIHSGSAEPEHRNDENFMIFLTRTVCIAPPTVVIVAHRPKSITAKLVRTLINFVLEVGRPPMRYVLAHREPCRN